MGKCRGWFLIVGVFFGVHAQGFNWLESLPKCEDPSPFVRDLEREVGRMLEEIKESRRVWTWTFETKTYRRPHYCINECACLFQELSARIPRATISDQVDGVWGIDIRNGKGILPVEIRSRSGDIASFAYHQALLVRQEDVGCYVVIDPIVARAKPMAPLAWVNTIDSCDQNDIRIWEIPFEE